MQMYAGVRHNAVITHGTVMGFAFAFLFPLGAILIRVASFRGLIWVHAAIQSLAYALALAGLGLGIYIAVYPESQVYHSFHGRRVKEAKISQITGEGNGHPIIGIVVISCLYLQPVLAILHHEVYKKTLKRTIWGTSHVWWGRIIITLGIINGGLGLQLSGNTTKGEIAYGVIAGVIWLVWVAVSVMSYLSSRGSLGETGEKISKNGTSNGSHPDRDGMVNKTARS